MITVANKRKPTYPNSTMAFDPPYFYIGRPEVLGNPFEIGKHGTREEVVAKYRTWLKEAYYSTTEYRVRISIDRMVLRHCEGESITLVCWCAPLLCHGDVIKEFVEELANARNDN